MRRPLMVAFSFDQVSSVGQQSSSGRHLQLSALFAASAWLSTEEEKSRARSVGCIARNTEFGVGTLGTSVKNVHVEGEDAELEGEKTSAMGRLDASCCAGVRYLNHPLQYQVVRKWRDGGAKLLQKCGRAPYCIRRLLQNRHVCARSASIKDLRIRTESDAKGKRRDRDGGS